MAFDIFLMQFSKEGLGDASAARKVMDEFDFEYKADPSYYFVKFEDGSHIELFAGGIHDDKEKFDGGMLSLHGGLSLEVSRFVYAFSRAAGRVLVPAMEQPCLLVPREDLIAPLAEGITDDFPMVPVASGEEVHAALEGGCEGWTKYRDRVVGDR